MSTRIWLEMIGTMLLVGALFTLIAYGIYRAFKD